MDCGDHGVCSLALGGVCVCDEGYARAYSLVDVSLLFLDYFLIIS